MRRFLRWLFFLLIILIIVMTIYLRVHRHAFDAAQPVRASVVRLHNAFADFYGAKSGSRVVLFDAGVDNEGKALDALLAALGATRDSVTDVFLTHAHNDHTGAASLLPNARIHAGAGDVELAAGTKSQGSILVRPFKWMLPAASVKVTDAMSARNEYPLGDNNVVTALPFPGHTSGSFIYFYQGVLFTGDAIIFDGTRLDFPPSLMSTDAGENKKSIAALGSQLGNLKVEVVCAGHGGCTTPADTTRLLEDVMERARQ